MHHTCLVRKDCIPAICIACEFPKTSCWLSIACAASAWMPNHQGTVGRGTCHTARPYMGGCEGGCPCSWDEEGEVTKRSVAHKLGVTEAAVDRIFRQNVPETTKWNQWVSCFALCRLWYCSKKVHQDNAAPDLESFANMRFKKAIALEFNFTLEQ